MSGGLFAPAYVVFLLLFHSICGPRARGLLTVGGIGAVDLAITGIKKALEFCLGWMLGSESRIPAVCCASLPCVSQELHNVAVKITDVRLSGKQGIFCLKCHLCLEFTRFTCVDS